MYIPLNLNSLYHLWLPLSLGSLHMKVGFLPLEAEMDSEAMLLICEWPQGK